MRKLIALMTMFLATSMYAGAASAQLPGLGIRLIPKAGLDRPLGDIETGLKMKDHVAIGLAAELHVPIIPFGLRANVDYSPAADINNTSGARVGTASITNLVGDLVFHPIPGIIPI